MSSPFIFTKAQHKSTGSTSRHWQKNQSRCSVTQNNSLFYRNGGNSWSCKCARAPGIVFHTCSHLHPAPPGTFFMTNRWGEILKPPTSLGRKGRVFLTSHFSRIRRRAAGHVWVILLCCLSLWMFSKRAPSGHNLGKRRKKKKERKQLKMYIKNSWQRVCHFPQQQQQETENGFLTSVYQRLPDTHWSVVSGSKTLELKHNESGDPLVLSGFPVE